MRYIVSGYRRTGTSMMVNALGQGLPGMGVLYSSVIETDHGATAFSINGYRPNPGGLYEVTQERYIVPGFLRDGIPDNSIVKVLYDGLPALPAGQWTVVFMTRDPAEIKQSLEKFQGWAKRIEFEYGDKKKEGNRYWPFDVFAPYSQNNIDHVIGICKQRKDIRLFVVDHHDVITAPLEAFKKLVADGFYELDPEAAATVVNPEFYRARV